MIRISRCARHVSWFTPAEAGSWETLAGFICSSNKQIVQIEQIIGEVCDRFGEPVRDTNPSPPPIALPPCTEAELRACRMGYRAKYLLGSAQMITRGELNLESLRAMPYDEACTEIQRLLASGPRLPIASCCLPTASPKPSPSILWIIKALHRLYFPRRAPKPKRLQAFIKKALRPPPRLRPAIFVSSRPHAGRVVGGNQ